MFKKIIKFLLVLPLLFLICMIEIIVFILIGIPLLILSIPLLPGIYILFDGIDGIKEFYNYIFSLSILLIGEIIFDIMENVLE